MTAPPGSEDATRGRVLAAAYECVARSGLAKTTIEDVARQSGLSRATIYRYFPGGRDELLRETVGWEMNRFFIRLAAAVSTAPDFTTTLVDGLVFAHAAVRDHVVLQKILETEPGRLLPLMTVETHRIQPLVSAYLSPLLSRELESGRLRPTVSIPAAADYLGRMILSLIGNPGSVDFDDPTAVRVVVERELLGGIRAVPGRSVRP